VSSFGFAFSIGSAVAAVVLYLLLRGLGSLIGREAAGWAPHLSRALAERAASQLPVKYRARYTEEWLAELATLEDRPVSAVAHAVGIAITSRRLARELGPAFEPADSPSTARRLPPLPHLPGNLTRPFKARLLRKWLEAFGASSRGGVVASAVASMALTAAISLLLYAFGVRLGITTTILVQCAVVIGVAKLALFNRK